MAGGEGRCQVFKSAGRLHSGVRIPSSVESFVASSFPGGLFWLSGQVLLSNFILIALLFPVGHDDDR